MRHQEVLQRGCCVAARVDVGEPEPVIRQDAVDFGGG